MSRVRIAFVALALALVLPVALLVRRALDGVAFERRVRHEAVAERVFDEMERALSRLLEREEARPFDHYRYFLAEPAPAPRRSPLSELPGDAFIVGYFQIDPDGSLHTPLQPGGRRGDLSPDVQRAIETTEHVVRTSWEAWAERRAEVRSPSAPERPRAEVPAPGATRRLADAEGEREREDVDEALPAASEVAREEATAYDVLQSLNRGGEDRAERRQKVSEEPYSVAYAPSAVQRSQLRSLGYLADDRGSDRPERSAAAEPAQPAESGAEADEAQSSAWRGRESALRGAAKRAAIPEEVAADAVGESAIGAGAAAKTGSRTDAAAPATVRVVLDPMVGRAAGDEHLILYRTVLVDRQGYRQGLVLERAALGRWLEGEVIAPSGLAGVAEVHFRRPGSPPASDPGGYALEHRFAEPFDALLARLILPPLPGVGSPNAIYGLAALLLAVGGLGLAAVYRTIGVTVDFAERRSRFVAAVTHELKTPLTSIRMYAEMLRDGLVPSDGKRDDYHRTITSEAERLSRLIDNVLEFSRLEKGGRELDLRAGALAPVLEEVVETLRPHAQSAGFSLRVEAEPDLPPVRFDRDALLQVLFNLVDNALKYARAATPREVVLEARRSGEGVLVAVRDFGPGVSRRQLGRIFEPFYRGEDELTRTTRGTGIGLALVKELVEAMGGALSGTNAPDGGFRVGILLRS